MRRVETVRPPDPVEAFPKAHRGSVAQAVEAAVLQTAVTVGDFFRGSDKLRRVRRCPVVARKPSKLKSGAGDRAVLVGCLALRANIIAALQQVA